MSDDSRSPAPFRRIAVFGPGLLGGSIVRAVAKRLPAAAVSVWGRRTEPLEKIRSFSDLAAASTDPAEVVAGADLIILATPVGSMGDLSRSIVESGQLSPACLATDVGSVKASVVDELEPLFADAGAQFIGSHPMAGSEKSGLDHAREDLFDGAACLLTPTDRSDTTALDRVDSFWKSLGCLTWRLSPDEHDHAVAMISHLPHVVAAALVEAVLADEPELGAFAGGGFRDTTRIAAGSADLWTEILLENREAVAEALRRFQTKIGESLAFFEDAGKEDLRRFLDDARNRREKLR